MADGKVVLGDDAIQLSAWNNNANGIAFTGYYRIDNTANANAHTNR